MTTDIEPATTDEDVLLATIRTCAASLEDLNGKLDAQLAARVALYRRGVQLGVSKAAMARAAGCSPEAVIHTLSRSKARG